MGFFFFFSLCLFAKKIYGFEGYGLLYWGYGFGVWLGSGFRVCFLLEIDYREEHNQHEHVLLKKIMKRKKRRRKTTRKTFN